LRWDGEAAVLVPTFLAFIADGIDVEAEEEHNTVRIIPVAWTAGFILSFFYPYIMHGLWTALVEIMLSDPIIIDYPTTLAACLTL
jgi:hypothetical protein